jgi:hypothetical protein
MNAKFLVAKYAPDVKRMEPRNIGVIVWVDGVTDSLFVGEDVKSGAQSTLPRRIGVTDRKNYWNWIASWRRQLNKAEIEVGRGTRIARHSPEFVEGMREWSGNNYMLVHGGEASAKPDAIRELTLYLFENLVAAESDAVPQEHESQQLKSRSTHIWKTLGVLERPDFHTDQPLDFKLFGQPRQFAFDYAFGPATEPYSVTHRVVLGHQKTFDSIIMNLEHFQKDRNYPKERMASIVIPSAAGTAESRESNLKALAYLTKVIDIASPEAMSKLGQMAAMNGKA